MLRVEQTKETQKNKTMKTEESKAIVAEVVEGGKEKEKWRVHFRSARRQEPRKNPPSHHQTALAETVGNVWRCDSSFQGHKAMASFCAGMPAFFLFLLTFETTR